MTSTEARNGGAQTGVSGSTYGFRCSIVNVFHAERLEKAEGGERDARLLEFPITGA